MLNKIVIMKIFYILKFQTGTSLATVNCSVVYDDRSFILSCRSVWTVLVERHKTTYVNQRKTTLAMNFLLLLCRLLPMRTIQCGYTSIF